jgi:hypothetical protein
MSDAPETDHLEVQLGQAAMHSHPILWEHSRRLERERDEARELLASEKITRDHVIKRGIEMQKERDEAREELHKASVEANALATSIQKAEYSNAKEFELLGSVAGVISQIDNMYAGVRQQRDEAREEHRKLKIILDIIKNDQLKS